MAHKDEELIVTGLIERAARALYQSAPHDFDPNQMVQAATWPDLVEQARAVLQAIREPSEKMVAAGSFAGAFDIPDGRYSASEEAQKVWEAMIDTALEEG